MRFVIVGFFISTHAWAMNCPLLTDSPDNPGPSVVAQSEEEDIVATLRAEEVTFGGRRGKWVLPNPKNVKIRLLEFCWAEDLLLVVGSERGNLGTVPLHPPKAALIMDDRVDRGPIELLLVARTGKFALTMHRKASVMIWYRATGAGFQSAWEQELRFVPRKALIPPGERGVFLLGDEGWIAYVDLFEGAKLQRQLPTGTPSEVSFSPAGRYATLRSPRQRREIEIDLESVR